MNIQSLIIHGFIFAVLAHLAITFILVINPRYEMKSYPKEILACVPPQTKQEKRGFIRIAIPLMSLLIGYLLWSVTMTYKGTGVGYGILWIQIFGMMSLWNIGDLFIMDWLLFCYIQPKFMALPGTQGHPGYKNYKYHGRGFFIGIGLSLVSATILACITMVII